MFFIFTFAESIQKIKVMKEIIGIKNELIIRLKEVLFDLKSINTQFNNIKGLLKSKAFKFGLVSMVLLMSFQSVVKVDSPNNSKKYSNLTDSTDVITKIEEPETPITYSDELVDLLVKLESVELTAYNIGDGAYTIGYGHAVFNNRKRGDGFSKYSFLKSYDQYIKMKNRGEDIIITQRQAEQLFRDDLTLASNALNRLLTKWDGDGIELKITQPMYDAMVSMIFNMGNGNFRKTDFIQLVKRNKFKEAVEAIRNTSQHLFGRYPGLIKRRAKEANLFKSGLL